MFSRAFIVFLFYKNLFPIPLAFLGGPLGEFLSNGSGLWPPGPLAARAVANPQTQLSTADAWTFEEGGGWLGWVGWWICSWCFGGSEVVSSWKM